MRKVKVGELPAGYDYRFIKTEKQKILIGCAQDKEPIGFVIIDEKIVQFDMKTGKLKEKLKEPEC